jgi:hypothetical protein
MTKRKLCESTMAFKPGANGTGNDIEKAQAKAQRDAPPVVPPKSKRPAALQPGRKPTWQEKSLATTKAKGRKIEG